MKVVGFKIEIAGQKNIVDTTGAIKELNKQLVQTSDILKEINKNAGKNLNQLSKDFGKTADSAEKLGAVVKSSFQSFEKGNKIVQGLGSNYSEVAESVEDAAKELKKLETIIDDDNASTKALIERNKELKKILESAPRAGTAAFEDQKENLEELAQEYANNQKQIKAFRNALKNGTIETDKAKGAIEALKDQQKELRKQYNALSKDQQKGLFGEGAKIAAQIRKTQKEIDQLNKRIRNSSRLSKTLTKTFTKLFIGRSIIEGAINGVRNLTNGLTNLVKEGDGSNAVFNQLEKSGNRLTSTLSSIGTTFLNAFGPAISKIIDNVAFSIDVIGRAFVDAANSGGILGNTLQFIGSIFTNFPAVIGGVVSVFGEFRDRIGNTFEEISLQAQRVVANVERIGTSLTGGDTAEVDRRLAEINERLAENVIAARTIGEAYQEGFDATIAAQEEFNARTDEEVKLQEKRAAAAKAREEAEKQAAAAESKRLEELAKQRNELLEQIKNENIVRIQLINQLGNDLAKAEIQSIEDTTERALAAEKARFEQERLLRENNFNNRVNEAKEQQIRLAELFGEFSEEFVLFEQQSSDELQALRDANRLIDEQKEEEHQQNLLKIQEDAKQQELEAERAFFAELEAELEAEAAAEAAIEEAALQASFQRDKERIEQRKKDLEDFLSTSQQISDAFFNAIQTFADAAGQAETARLDAAISNREKSIASLNEQLQNATGLQKKFLEEQVEAEKKALAEEQEAREKAEKQRVKDAQALALVQAIINGALAITRAFSDLGPIAGAIAAVGVAAGIAAQIATISSQKFAEGGVLSGPSHAGGGVPISIGGGAVAEAEGGEAIINRRSTSMFRPLLSAINQAGGGKKFQTGGIIGPAVSAPVVSSMTNSENINQLITAFDARTAAISQQVSKTQVILDLNNLQDVQDNDNSLDVLTTL